MVQTNHNYMLEPPGFSHEILSTQTDLSLFNGYKHICKGLFLPILIIYCKNPLNECLTFW